ncbi:MAG: DUF2934 domain-containing protein [Sulfuricella sp.]
MVYNFKALGRVLKKTGNSVPANTLTTRLEWETKLKSKSTKSRIGSKIAPSPILESKPLPGVEDRIKYISTTAYYKAEARGFAPGRELDDWLEAEKEFVEKSGLVMPANQL